MISIIASLAVFSSHTMVSKACYYIVPKLNASKSITSAAFFYRILFAIAAAAEWTANSAP